MGPGCYEPVIDITKPKKKGTNFGDTNAPQRPEVKNAGRFEVPGPGEYTFSNDTITMKQMHNVIKREE